MTFKVVNQLNQIGTMQTIMKPNCNLCMQERLTILKKLRGKHVKGYGQESGDNLAELLNRDLAAKNGRGIFSKDLMDRKCNFYLPSKVNGKCVYKGKFRH